MFVDRVACHSVCWVEFSKKGLLIVVHNIILFMVLCVG